MNWLLTNYIKTVSKIINKNYILSKISKINFRTPICSTLNTTLYQLDAYVKSCRNTRVRKQCIRSEKY